MGETLRLESLVDQRNEGIHDEDGEGDSFRIGAPETDDHGDKTASHTEHDHAPLGCR